MGGKGLWLALAVAGMAAGPCAADQKPVAIRAGRILTVTRGSIDNGVIVIRDRKIVAVGKQGEVPIPPDAEVIDASDRWVMPGQIDLHTHIGNNSGLHDYVHSLNPEFRVWDFIDPDSPQIQDDIASGITTILTIPGSGGNHSGFGVLWKLGGAPREELILRKLGGMKVAQAYNPERRAGDLGLSRMGMWWMLRDLFTRGQKYEQAWEEYERYPGTAPQPAVQPDLEQIRAVFQRKTPVFVHTAGGRDVVGTMRMFHDEFHLPVIVSHGEFGAFRIAEEAAKRGVPVNVGPRLYDFSSQVYDRKFYSIPGEYARAGVKNVSLNTDCPVIPGDELFLQGTLAVRLGMDEESVLRALTINPAEAIGIADRVGSIEVGKDADLVIKRGSLLDPRTPVDLVLINGTVVYRHGQTRRGASRRGQSAPRDDDGCEGAGE
jgi:imidazolonepropionase-like amidohydrolase